MGKLLNKLFLPKYIKEMQNGKNPVVATINTDALFRQVVEWANQLGYKVQSMNQSSDLWAWGTTKHTVIFVKQ